MEQTQVKPGCSRLVAALDEAVGSNQTPKEITHAVRDVLTDLIGNGKVTLPEELCRPADDSYARRLIHSNPELEYTALAMVWGPNQGTPLHDHDGLWCVEGVLHGRIEVVQYQFLESSGSLYRFRREDEVVGEVGSAGTLIPPYDYHTIHNALSDRPSVTIHVYGGEMSSCSIFEPRHEDWYELTTRQLALTA